MRKRAAFSAAALVLCALSLVGCGSFVRSLPKVSLPPLTTAAPAALCAPSPGLVSACRRLGDLTTLDPCSLVSLGQLPADLAASPLPRESLDYCAFRITAGADKAAEVEVGQLEAADDAGARRYDAGSTQLQPAGLDLEQGSVSGGACYDAVQFQGDVVDLQINVFAMQGEGDQALCDAANEVGKAVGVVLNGKTQMQHFTVPRNSIAKLHACGLANDARIGSYTLDDQPETPSGHYCIWQPDTSDYTVEFGISLEIGSDALQQGADSHTKIHGLDTYTIKYDDTDDAQCEVDTYRIPWGTTGSGLHEIASIWTIEPAGQIDAACTAATQIATVVWPKLPPLK